MAVNTLVTPTWMGREVLAVAENECRFVRGIEKKLGDEFKEGGVKLGATVGVRLPWRPVTTKGQAFVGQSIVDTIVYVTITDQANIGWGYSSIQSTLEVQDAYERFVNPAAAQMSNTWDADGLQRLYKDVYQSQGTPGTVPISNSTYFNAATDLTMISAVPKNSRVMVINPIMAVAIANANVTIFNPSKDISGAWKDGQFMSKALAWEDWEEDVNVYPHTYGTYSGTPLVNGAGQTGATLVTKGWGSGVSGLNVGDVFTIGSGATGVYAVNVQSHNNTSLLQKFVVTQTINDTTGAMSISISPSIITSGGYQNVVAAPGDNATINVIGASATVSPQGLGFHKQAFVMASATPVMPNQGKARIVKKNGMAIRFWEGSDIMTDQHPSRLDSFYGFRTIRADWAERIQS